jgi:outer membrane protein assembly factor BamB
MSNANSAIKFDGIALLGRAGERFAASTNLSRLSRGGLPALLLFTATCTATAAESLAPNWPQFRGVNGAGVSADATPPVKIGPTEGVLWSIEMPWSPSSPSVWGDRIFLTTFNEDQLETRCHDRADGRLRWARQIKPEAIEEHHRQDGSPAAATPATDGRHVVSYFG